MNDALTKFTAIKQLVESTFMVVLNATNGDMLTAKEFQYPSLTLTSFQIFASGKISDDKTIISARTDDSHLLTVVNTATWVANTFYAAGSSINLYSFVPLFNTDQIILIYYITNSHSFTLQTAYDKLDKTEMFTT